MMMVQYDEHDDALRLEAVRLALSALNAPAGEERERAVADRLMVVTVTYADPRGPTYPALEAREVRVMDKHGAVRLTHDHTPMRVVDFLAELVNTNNAARVKDADVSNRIAWTTGQVRAS